MHEPFFITLNYEGSELELKARFERYGYTHRITVLIDEVPVLFEPDEEGYYRALGHGDPSIVRPGLLQAVAEKLRTLTT